MTSIGPSSSRDRQAQAAAALILDGFVDYNAQFADITRRATRRFARRDWKSARRDADARIDLYAQCIREALARLDVLLDDRVRSRPLWSTVRALYEARLDNLPDRELFKTWFNSLSRRAFRTEGVAADIEFVALGRDPYTEPSDAAPHRRYRAGDALPAACLALLREHAHAELYKDIDHSAQQLAEALAQRQAEAGLDPIEELHVLDVPFYRERRAYLVGRLRASGRRHPLVIALMHGPGGVRIDALLTDPAEISILFGYARSYFHADIANVGAAVAFVHALLPHKPLEELYTVLGRARQGKTERYRRVFSHLALNPQERLVQADGQRGMVMAVFTPSDLPVVFKVIRDRFAWPKDIARKQVEEKYRLVFHHDRVGRLVDAQEFRQLRFPLRQVAPAVRDELLDECAETVRIDGDNLVIAHCYVEHRLRPLDLYVREVPEAEAIPALCDYGQAVKDLAGSNIFPGDLLLKNFGISRNGRAVFYDYDELCALAECHFRAVPPMHDDDETRPLDDTVYAAPGDVFPELFVNFLGVRKALRDALIQAHGEIFDPVWWRDLQAHLQAGEYVDVPPYPESARLRDDD